MSKHYLLQKQNGIIIKKTVKDWAREPQNQKKFPKYSFQRPYNTDTTPTSEEIDAQLLREGCKREVFNGDYYCYDPNDISDNDLLLKKYKTNNVMNLKEFSNNISEKIHTQNIKNTSTHPWLKKYKIDTNSKYLIIGTHPPMPYNENNLQYFYGNMKEFWRLLDKVYPIANLFNNGNPQLTDILKFQIEKSISVTDMVYITHVRRFSTDKEMGKIEDIDLNPFLREWLENSIVDTIYFTSFGGSNSAKNLFKRWIKTNYGLRGVITNSHFNEIILPNNRIIKLIDLFSPSPTARRSKNKIQEFIIWNDMNKTDEYDMFRIDWYKKYLPK